MGLNIGIEFYSYEQIKSYSETSTLEDELIGFLKNIFSSNESYSIRVTERPPTNVGRTKESNCYKYDLDIRLFRYGGGFYMDGYCMNDMYLALFSFILSKISISTEGILDMKVYYSG